MAEAYHKESFKLCDSGKSQSALENAEWFDPDRFAVSHSGQVFDDWQTRVSNLEAWHFVPGMNTYFRSERDSHGIIKALETLFTPERWAEIDHVIEDERVVELLWRCKYQRLKKKIVRAKNKGLLTQDDTQLMAQIFGNGSL